MRDRLAIPMSLALLISVALHISALVPLLVHLTATTDARVLRASFDPQDFRKPSAPEPPNELELSLGLDAPSPSTFTWVGYTEYQKHLAALADVEQAAFTDEPLAAAKPTDVSELIEPAHDQLPDETQQQESQPPPAMDVLAAFEMPLTELRQFIDELRVALAQARAESVRPPRPSPPNEVSQPSASQPQDQPMARNDTQGRNDPATAADKQSDPSSIVEVSREHWQLGKPLAAQGLEIRPRRPEFTILTLLTAAPGNPLCKIVFGRDGVPIEAAILRSSGDTRVDEAILASLYRWRAAGVPLESLSEDSRVEVQITILLTRRRAA